MTAHAPRSRPAPRSVVASHLAAGSAVAAALVRSPFTGSAPLRLPKGPSLGSSLGSSLGPSLGPGPALRPTLPRWARSFAVSVVLGSSALGAVGCQQQAAAVEEKHEPPVSVEVAEVTLIQAPQTLRLTGSLRGAKQTDLAANVAGRVQQTLVERGTEVKKGAVLARIDVSAAALALAEARVQVEASKTRQEINQADCDRYELLKAKGAVTDLEYDQVTAKCKTAPLDLAAAQARQTLAAKNVGDGVIRSPFDGVVTERYIEVGEYVQASSRVVSLAQVDDLRLEFSLPEANFTHVKVDADVAFRVVAYGDAVFRGKVTHISGAVRETRDVLVEASVPNPERRLLPGMFADVELNVGMRELPSVPKAAVFEQNAKQNVFVVKDGRLEQRVVQTAPEWQERVPVLRGLSAGEQVVAVLQPGLHNGQPVK